MIRLLIFIFAVVFFAAAATLLFSLGDTVRVEAFGWKADAPAGIAGAFAALLFGAVAAIVSIVKDITAIRRRSALRQIIKRRNRGVDALVEAAAALGAGKDARALSLSLKAARLLDRDDVAALFAPVPAPQRAGGVDPEPETDEARDTALQKRVVPSPQEALTPAPMPLSLPDGVSDGVRETVAALEAEEALDRDAAAARRVS